MHDVIMKHAEPHWRQGRNTDPRLAGAREARRLCVELKALHTRAWAASRRSWHAGTAFCAGDECTYADLFIYTCVTTVRFSVPCGRGDGVHDQTRDSVRPAPSTRRSLRTGAQLQGSRPASRAARRVLRRLLMNPELAAKVGEREKSRGGGRHLDQAPV